MVNQSFHHFQKFLCLRKIVLWPNQILAYSLRPYSISTRQVAKDILRVWSVSVSWSRMIKFARIVVHCLLTIIFQMQIFNSPKWVLWPNQILAYSLRPYSISKRQVAKDILRVWSVSVCRMIKFARIVVHCLLTIIFQMQIFNSPKWVLWPNQILAYSLRPYSISKRQVAKDILRVWSVSVSWSRMIKFARIVVHCLLTIIFQMQIFNSLKRVHWSNIIPCSRIQVNLRQIDFRLRQVWFQTMTNSVWNVVLITKLKFSK